MKIVKTAKYKKAFDNYLENSPSASPDVWQRYRERAVESFINGQ